MQSISTTGPSGAPPTIITIRAGHVRRRIATSDSVAALVASLAFGEPRRGDLAALASVTASRCAAPAGASL